METLIVKEQDHQLRISPALYATIENGSIKDITVQLIEHLTVLYGRIDFIIDFVKRFMDTEYFDESVLEAFIEKVCEHDVREYVLTTEYVSSTISTELRKSRLRDAGYLLHLTIYLNNTSITKALIEAGCNVNATELTRFTVLHVAADHDLVDQVRLLLEYGADPNAEDDSGKKPIAYANTVGTLRLLLDAGTDIHSLDQRGDMQLKNMIERGSKEVVKAILEYGPDLACSDEIGENMIHYAARNINAGVAELFLTQKFDPNFTRNGYLPLYTAMKGAYTGNEMIPNLKFVWVLLTLGANCEDSLSSPLVYWTKNRNAKSVKRYRQLLELLLAYGADVNAKFGCFEKCIMEVAIDFGYFELTSLLVEHVAYMQKMNLRVRRQNIQAIRLYENYRKHFNAVKAELKAMKKRKIMDSVSYFDVLVDTVDEIAVYARNKKLRLTFEREIENLFPLNRRKLKNKFKAGIEWIRKIDVAVDFISNSLEINRICAGRIVIFLKFDYKKKLLKYVDSSFTDFS